MEQPQSRRNKTLSCMKTPGFLLALGLLNLVLIIGTRCSMNRMNRGMDRGFGSMKGQMMQGYSRDGQSRNGGQYQPNGRAGRMMPGQVPSGMPTPQDSQQPQNQPTQPTNTLPQQTGAVQ